MPRMSSLSPRFSPVFMPAAGSSSRSSSRLQRQRAGDLQPPLVAVGEVAGLLAGPVGEADQLQQLHRPLRGSRAPPRRAKGSPSTPLTRPLRVRT